jgi:diguanylate cyclase (GGDEF)-like protein/PAS domain S-box-containing protein
MSSAPAAILGDEAYRALYDHGPDGVLFTAPDGRILAANAAACLILGRTEAEICALGRQGMADETDGRWALMQAERERTGRVRGVARLIRGDGVPIEVEMDAEMFTEAASGEQRSFTTVRDVSDRVALEQELAVVAAQLRDSRAQWKALLDHAPMAISLGDLDGRFLFAHRPAIESLRFNDVTGLANAEIYEPALAARLDDAERSVREGNGTATTELTAAHPGGTDHDYLVIKYPINDVHGDVVAVGGISLDVTQRTRAEQAVAQMATIIEATDDGVISKSIDGEILSWNPAAERIYGYSSQEAIGRSISFLVPPGRDDEIPQILARLARGEHVLQFETVRRRKDGVDIDVSLTLSPIHDQHGVVVGASTIVRDVTQARIMRAKLRASEELFRTTVDNAPVGIAIVGPDGRWLRVNRILCQLTGYSEDELVGKSFDSISHPDDLKSDLEQRRLLMEGKISSYEIEKRLIRADGETLWGLVAVSLVRSPEGAPVRLVCQMLDITQRKHQQDELRHLADHDTLTGLANRRTFGEHITRLLAQRARHDAPLALLMIDVDNFKPINDRLGHQVGDVVLRAAAETLRGRLRESDIVGRLGGDEFAFLLPETERAGAESLAQDLLDAFAALRPVPTEPEFSLSASIGVVTVDRTGTVTEEELLDAADAAMYQAKAAGRGRYAVVDHKALVGAHGGPSATGHSDSAKR